MREGRAIFSVFLWSLTLASSSGLADNNLRDIIKLTRPATVDYALGESIAQTTIQSMLLDSHKRLWIGAQGGPAYLSGQGWTPFPLPREAPSRWIRAMLESSDGSLWFGTDDGGIWRLLAGKWTHFAGQKDLPVSRINCLAEIEEGGQSVLLAGTHGGGLFVFEGSHWRRFGPVETMADPVVWKVRQFTLEDGTKEVWIADGSGVLARRHGKWQRMGPETGFRQGSANDVIRYTGPDGMPAVWASCWLNGLARWNGTRWTYYGSSDGLTSIHPVCLAITQAAGHDVLWTGTYDSGVFLFENEKWHWQDLQEELPNQSVYTMLANPGRAPALWVGGRGGNLVGVHSGGWRRLHTAPVFPHLFANSLLEAESGPGERSFWIGTNQDLVKWNGRELLSEKADTGLAALYINDLKALATPRGGEVWAATMNGVLRRQAGRWQVFGDSDGLPRTVTNVLLPSRDSGGGPAMWAGMNGSLARWENGHWQLIRQEDGLPHPDVFSLVERRDPDGVTSLWVGFRGGGIARFRNGKWTRFGLETGLPNLTVRHLALTNSQSGQSWLWASTVGYGVARLDPDHPERGFTVFDSQRIPEMRSDIIYRIEQDAAGRLYLLTGWGVVRFTLDPTTGVPVKVRTYTTGDGLPSSAGLHGPSTTDHLGRIWFGTAAGVAVLDPREEIEPRPPDGPFLDRVLLDGQVVSGAAASLDYGAHRLVFEFNLPAFHRREDIRYRTQVSGLEKTPGDWQKESRREFSSLPPGKFRLLVWARDSQGTVYGPLHYPIRVEAPPWRRPWARFIYVLLAIGAVVTVIRLRTSYLRRSNQRLENLVKQRTLELDHANRVLADLAITDPLTGLRNRRSLEIVMPPLVQQALRRRFRQGEQATNCDLVFIMIDLDHFKNVNDEHGHITGDLVLKGTAAAIRESVRESDYAVRMGGEEFLVVAVDASMEEASVLVERLRERIGSQLHPLEDGRAINCTASLGFALLPIFLEQPGLVDWERVIGFADECLYEAKKAGRNRWTGIVPVEGLVLPSGFDQRHMRLSDLLEQNLVRRSAGPSADRGPSEHAIP